jgi:hypothetical protein
LYEKKNNITVCSLLRNRSIGSQKRWNDNIKMDLRKIVCGNVDDWERLAIMTSGGSRYYRCLVSGLHYRRVSVTGVEMCAPVWNTLTNSMEQSHWCESDSRSTGQDILHHLWSSKEVTYVIFVSLRPTFVNVWFDLHVKKCDSR